MGLQLIKKKGRREGERRNGWGLKKDYWLYKLRTLYIYIYICMRVCITNYVYVCFLHVHGKRKRGKIIVIMHVYLMCISSDPTRRERTGESQRERECAGADVRERRAEGGVGIFARPVSTLCGEEHAPRKCMDWCVHNDGCSSSIFSLSQSVSLVLLFIFVWLFSALARG